MALPTPVPGLQQPTSGALLDRFARRHDYLRVSVTDRCNYRCTYCMPAEGLQWLKRDHLLTFEEIERVVRVFAGLGVRRVRLTGGEPTVRKDLPKLVEMLAAIPGIEDLAMTTNGHLFAPAAERFARAGLKRINVSIDSLDPEQFRRITRGGDLGRVLAAIEAARSHGITPIKLNCVVVAGENEDQVLPLVERFAAHAADTEVRFIEYMPFEKDDRRKHLPVRVLRERIGERYTLEPVPRAVGGGPARDWRIRETGQTIGFISPITEHFCHACNRLRLQADGHLRTCLSRDGTPSLRELLCGGIGDEALAAAVREMVWGKVAGHEADKEEGWVGFEGVMTSIGG